ncbi:MAG: branched-chain amino acid ABC transporter substrate-binding protein, partial [Gemmatimonadota bacterium]
MATAVFRIAALAATITTLASCRNNAVIRIGLTGAISDSLTISMKHAADLAVDEINASGGIDGRRLELVERDDFGNADSAVKIANDFYASDVVAVVGHSFSGPTIAAAPVYNGGRNPVTQISPSASSPDVSNAGPYTFRVCPTDLAHGAALARYAWTNLGLRRAAVLYNNNGYGRGIRQTFVDEFTRLGGELISVDPYLGDRPDVSPYVERLAKHPADFIVVAGYRSEAEEILRQARARGVNVPLMGGDGLEQIEQSGILAEGVYVTAAYSPEISTPANRHFVDAYTRRYPTG